MKKEENAFTRFRKKHAVPYMALTLLVLTAVVGLVLSFVHGLVATDDGTQALVEAVAQVMPGAASSEPLEDADLPPLVASAREVYDGAEQLMGYAIEATPGGFGGEIRLLVGVSPEGAVTGLTIMEMKETPNLGTKVENEEFLQQFVGRESGFKMGPGADVQAISGATVSSQAVYKGVEAAIAAVLQITGGGAE